MQTSQSGFQTGQASLTIATVNVPTSGSLLVEKSGSSGTAAAGYDGVAGLDTFQLIAKDWVGSQGLQLEYEFRYMLVRTPCCYCMAAYWHGPRPCMS